MEILGKVDLARNNQFLDRLPTFQAAICFNSFLREANFIYIASNLPERALESVQHMMPSIFRLLIQIKNSRL